MLPKFLKSLTFLSIVLICFMLFMLVNYQKIIYLIEPDNQKIASEYAYYPIVNFILSHVDAFALGLISIAVLFQERNLKIKLLFCAFEGAFVVLVLMRKNFGEDAQIYLSLYFGAFVFASLLILSNLIKNHPEYNAGENKNVDNSFDNVDNSKSTQEIQKPAEVLSIEEKSEFLAKHKDIADLLKDGQSLNVVAQSTKKSKSTVQKVRLFLSELGIKTTTSTLQHT